MESVIHGSPVFLLCKPNDTWQLIGQRALKMWLKKQDVLSSVCLFIWIYLYVVLLVHTRSVTGSNPVGATITKPLRINVLKVFYFYASLCIHGCLRQISENASKIRRLYFR